MKTLGLPTPIRLVVAKEEQTVHMEIPPELARYPQKDLMSKSYACVTMFLIVKEGGFRKALLPAAQSVLLKLLDPLSSPTIGRHTLGVRPRVTRK